MSSHMLDNGSAAFTFSRNNLLAMAEDIPEAKLCHPLAEGGNHTLWILGHLATTDDYFLTNLGNREAKCPATYDKLFGMGSTPTPNAGDYPPLTEIKEQLQARRDELLAWFKSMSAEQLAAPLPKDFAAFAPNFGALMSSLVWHEGLHTGQLTMIRRSLGMPPKFG